MKHNESKALQCVYIFTYKSYQSL